MRRLYGFSGNRLHRRFLRDRRPLVRQLGIGQHQLDPVFLIDPGSARIVIHTDDVGLRQTVFDLPHHSFTHHMIGQAAEGLRADDIGGA